MVGIQLSLFDEEEKPLKAGNAYVLDISEVTTGCRCTSTNKAVSSSTKADIITAMDKFIQDKGLRNLQAEIKKRQPKS